MKKQKLNQSKHIKEPKSDVLNPDAQHPFFSFRFLQSKFGIETCNYEQIKGFIKQLNHVSQLTWGKWKMASRTGIGYEKISISSIKASPPGHITADIDFLAFRFHNGRCVGYRDGIMFYIVWVDGKFEYHTVRIIIRS